MEDIKGKKEGEGYIRHLKDTSHMSLKRPNSNGHNGQEARDLLTKNPTYRFAHTKAERLSTAVYMVTRYMPEREPLRTTLRGESLKLLSRIYLLEEREAGDSVTSIISEIISLLDIAYRSQYLSEMNWHVIRREFISFGSFIEERGSDTTCLLYTSPSPRDV